MVLKYDLTKICQICTHNLNETKTVLCEIEKKPSIKTGECASLIIDKELLAERVIKSLSAKYPFKTIKPLGESPNWQRNYKMVRDKHVVIQKIGLKHFTWLFILVSIFLIVLGVIDLVDAKNFIVIPIVFILMGVISLFLLIVNYIKSRRTKDYFMILSEGGLKLKSKGFMPWRSIQILELHYKGRVQQLIIKKWREKEILIDLHNLNFFSGRIINMLWYFYSRANDLK